MKFVWYILIFLSIVNRPLLAEQTTFIVGTQDFDYYPHYNFRQSEDRGYAWSVLEGFAAVNNLKFRYVPLPPERLQMELAKGTIDFAYPDNARWDINKPDREGKFFSQPIAISVAGTLVKPEFLSRDISTFKSLAFPRGFTPVKFFEFIEQHQTRLIRTHDAKSALQAVLLGRADGADIEYNVARYLLGQMGKSGQLVIDTRLPISFVDFNLSTRSYPQILERLNRYLHASGGHLDDLQRQYELKQSQRIKDYPE